MIKLPRDYQGNDANHQVLLYSSLRKPLMYQIWSMALVINTKRDSGH